MTRKDYVRIADQLRACKPKEQAEHRGWEKAVDAVALAFRQDNYRFDKSRFYEACGRD
jgi:hypothetical protein